MGKWARMEGLQFKFSKQAFENYSNSDYYIYKHTLTTNYRICVSQSEHNFVFQTTDFEQVEDFFKNLYIESIAF